MRLNRLWLKMAAVSAATALVAVLIVALSIRNATTAGFNSYLQHVGRMGQMMGGGLGMMGVPETTFLDSVRNSLWIAGIVSVALAALLAFVFSGQITAPLRRLSAAAGRVAQGDLSCRVARGSADEVGVLANTFNCMVESLDSNQQMRRKLMADVAHEMSTPLAVIQSNLEGMLDGVVQPSASTISSLHQETTTLSRLVRDLRTLSMAEGGRLNLAPAPGDLGALVASIVTATEPEARAKRVSLSTRIEANLPPAIMDPDRISQVVMNLLSNALRYTSEGDSIEVGVSYDNRSRTQPSLLVSVSDTGQGISEEDLPHVFERYYRGSQSREKRVDGSGIGLTVVKELVEAHGGIVRVESVRGKGSTFCFTMPALSTGTTPAY